MSEERIQKIMARAGVGSRRACEDLIRAGRVHVNGKVAHLGDSANPRTDKITVDYEALPAPEPLVYIALHKPRGVESTVQSQGGLQTVRDLVPVSERVYPVGRLDVESEGLLLLTNDGELTNHLTHPRYGSEKEYQVKINGHPRDEQLEIWRRGLVLPDTGEQTGPARVSVFKEGASGTWLKVVMREGKKHQIRRVCETLGLPVKRLIRVRMATLTLGKLQPGEWRHLDSREVVALQRATTPSGRTSQRKGRAANTPPNPGPKHVETEQRRPANRPKPRTDRPAPRLAVALRKPANRKRQQR